MRSRWSGFSGESKPHFSLGSPRTPVVVILCERPCVKIFRILLEVSDSRAGALGCLSDERARGEKGGEIKTRPWGKRSFYVEDPFGNGVCIVDERTILTGT